MKPALLAIFATEEPTPYSDYPGDFPCLNQDQDILLLIHCSLGILLMVVLLVRDTLNMPATTSVIISQKVGEGTLANAS